MNLQIIISRMKSIYADLLNGNLQVAYVPDNLGLLQAEAIRLLNLTTAEMNQDDVEELDWLIKISNVIYNNADVTPPVEDGIYDLLMTRYHYLKPDYQVGAPSVDFGKYSEVATVGFDSIDSLKTPVIFEPESCREGLFYSNITATNPIDFSRLDVPVDRTNFIRNNSKNIVVPHKYPKLVGTLDKCKFVLNKEAMEAGCFDDPDIMIFERDFLGKHIMQGIINPNMPITLIVELKYDGISVEGDVTNKILSARSRGDTNQDLAQDFTPVLQGYVFPNAPEIPESESFGMKFEAIITKRNLYKLGLLRGKTYANSRNGVAGLMGSLDAGAYRDLITLVPLETSLDIDPITEIEFMNKYFTTDVLMKYAVVQGTYDQVLYQVYKFAKEAEAIRPYMPFLYDGIVVHYYDQNIRNILGRKNSVNQYSIAIKFNPMVKEATFIGYSFTVGQNGVITPLIHHTPIEFIGTIHTKSSGHSLQRFNDLALAPGDKIEVQYRNDVMPYVNRKVIDISNPRHDRIEVQFPKYCPSCGEALAIFDSGKTAICQNVNCPGKILARMTNMMKKLNLKGFAEASIRKLGIQSFSDLLSLVGQPDIQSTVLKQIGEANGLKLIMSIETFLNTPVDDYRVVGSIGFTDIAIETWKKILREVSLNDIINLKDTELYNELINIKGIGEVVTQTIINERKQFENDLNLITRLGNIINTYHTAKKKSIRYTGCRPTEELTERLYALGFDANPNASVTKSTDFLIVPEVGHQSTKIGKAGPETKIIAMDEFVRNLDYYLRL